MRRIREGRALLGALYIYNAIVGLFGGLTVAGHLVSIGMIAPGRVGIVSWIAICACAMAVVAFHRYQHWLGHPGFGGVAKAVLGCGLMLMLSALVVGTLTAPVVGTLYAPVVMLAIMASGPTSVAVLMIDILASHLMMMLWRAQTEQHPFAEVSPIPGERASG